MRMGLSHYENKEGDSQMSVKERNFDKLQKNRAKVVIIGLGFAGIAAAIRLKQEGENDFIILERGHDVGGVWRDNHYPGCACDVESHLYSLSFAPNPNWSRRFSPQSEIYAYLQDCAKRFGLLKHVRFHHEVKRMDWQEESGQWLIQTNNGEFESRITVGAFGALSDPSIPNLKGIDKFKGEAFHSAAWPKDFNPKGKRVAVVGTGASAIQFIPAIQPDVDSMHVFQRTPAWVMPRPDSEIRPAMQKLYRKMPMLQRAARFKIYVQRESFVLGFRNPKIMKKVKSLALHHMRKAVKDPILREKLTPDYTICCKRILLSNTYYPALAEPNVDVVTTGIAEITEDSVVDVKGHKVEVDTIIFGTGFKVTDLPFAHYIFGKDGRSMADVWNGSPEAYAGTTVSGYPNLFILQGPNTGLGHSSVIFMVEAQIDHMIKVLKHMHKEQIDIIEPHLSAQKNFVKETEESMQGTVWTAGGCDSWYLDRTGRNSTLWPGYTFSFRKLVAKLKRQDYEGRRAAVSANEAAPFLRQVK